jgi:hypothetical protein
MSKQGDMIKNKEEIKEKSQHEVAEWMKLSEEHLHILQRLQKVCYFCSEKMSAESINMDCPVNSMKKLPPKCSCIYSQ